MKKIICFMLVMLMMAMLCSCESKESLYKNRKDYYIEPEASVDSISNYYNNIIDFEKKNELQDGEFVLLDTDDKEQLRIKIEDLIDDRFDMGYIELLAQQENRTKLNYQTFDKSIDDFHKSIIDNEAIISVKYADVPLHQYVKKYNKNNQLYYVVTINLILYSSARNNRFFFENTHLNNGDTPLQLQILCEDNLEIDIVKWTEYYFSEQPAVFEIKTINKD